MNNINLGKVINQIYKYELIDFFDDVEQFNRWASNLNDTQVRNLISLKINIEEIRNFRRIIKNTNLLNCRDYIQKIHAISKLKNGEGCWNYFDNLCNPVFLKSKNFYKDIEVLSGAHTPKYGLKLFSNDDFINSPYHDEDLRLVVKTYVNKGNQINYLVSDALASVAVNIDSINSPYHQADMKLISEIGLECLQPEFAYRESSIDKLAINKVSLKDRFHLENMKILSTNPIARDFLYSIMTNLEMVSGKYYRKEVEALLNAKSKTNARALYYYILNPDKIFDTDRNFSKDYSYDLQDEYFVRIKYVADKNNPDYIKYLSKILNMNDSLVMYYVSLLMNPEFLNSKYKKFDLELLEQVSNKPIFMDLYRLMTDDRSLNGEHHKKDTAIISKTESREVRKLLLEKAVDEYSLISDNHEYDMEYISKLNLNNIDDKIHQEILYYMFNEKGLKDSKRKEVLEKLCNGILVERSSDLSSYLDILKSQIPSAEKKLIRKIPEDKPKTKKRAFGVLGKLTTNFRIKDD